jgi:hypothetical protein
MDTNELNVKRITYKRIKNLGNYESKTLEMTAEVDEDQYPHEVTQALMKAVDSELFPQAHSKESTEDDVAIPF